MVAVPRLGAKRAKNLDTNGLHPSDIYETDKNLWPRQKAQRTPQQNLPGVRP